MDETLEMIAADLKAGLSKLICEEDEAGDGEAITFRVSPMTALAMFGCTISGLVAADPPLTLAGWENWCDFMAKLIPKFPLHMRLTLERMILAAHRQMFPADWQRFFPEGDE